MLNSYKHREKTPSMESALHRAFPNMISTLVRRVKLFHAQRLTPKATGISGRVLTSYTSLGMGSPVSRNTFLFWHCD